ncbi:hypothetical protein PIB30_109753 [Stylosanthes scabra]|uniref:Uncharacterized protein n=1 Tax=Stylosanthes scabra TaxID=79078 RepID=A0ABU6TZ84_9FABA|nr:hypothetical protein [Stylosanthes scabra]
MNSEFRAMNSKVRPVNSEIRPTIPGAFGTDECYYKHKQERKKQKERKERKEMRVVVVVPPFGGRNFHTGAPIDAPFAATQSSRLPLRFYPNN